MEANIHEGDSTEYKQHVASFYERLVIIANVILSSRVLVCKYEAVDARDGFFNSKEFYIPISEKLYNKIGWSK